MADGFAARAEGGSSIRLPAMAFAVILLALGIAGILDAAWGYGLFLLSTLVIGLGVVLGGILLFTSHLDGDKLVQSALTALRLGGWCYVLAVAALAGYFIHETIEGRMPWKWVVFGPAALAALIVLDWGLYRVIYLRNRPTFERYRDVISRERIDKPAIRRAFVDEVVLHRTLSKVSLVRWLRHQLIFWGFGLMFGLEIGALFMREVFPALGLPDLWHTKTHPLRLAWDLGFDITGLMMLVGCVMALVYRIQVQGTEEQKYTDTPTVLFLLAVVVTGFLLEGARIAAETPAAHHLASPVGLATAWLVAPWFGPGSRPPDLTWIVHALLSLGFIAYVPLKRLIHSCAVPIGRLMSSQKGMLAAKKERVLRGLLERRR